MTEYLSSGDQLKGFFNFDSSPEYQEFHSFSKEVGFSVQRRYPEYSNFAPPKKRDGSPDTFALIRIRYSPEQVTNENQNLVPISVAIGTHSRYILNHFDYDFTDDDCPTEESVLASKRTPRPLELIFLKDYFFDHKKNTFVDQNGKEIEGIEILNHYYELHLATIDKFKGKVLKWKMSSTYKMASICRLVEILFKWLLRVLFGRTLESDASTRHFFGSKYRQEDLKLLKTERIDVFGYRASKNVIITFCLILLISYFLSSFYNFAPGWLKTIGKNNLLSFALAVISIAVLDNILPKILFKLVNISIVFKSRLINKKFKFK